MIQFALENFAYEGTLLEGRPATTALDRGPLRDIELRDVSRSMDADPESEAVKREVAGLRFGGEADLNSVSVSGLVLNGFQTGVAFEVGTAGRDVEFRHVRLRDVDVSYDVEVADIARAIVSFPTIG